MAFREQRFLPFQDLAALIRPAPSMRVVDLGCGTGELTARLARRLPGSSVLGIDRSPEMLDRAKKHAGVHVRFKTASIESFAGFSRKQPRPREGGISAPPPGGDDGLPWDLLFSHAALHWVPDHPGLFRLLWKKIRPSGQLAVQMPANHDHAVQRLVRETAGEEPYRTALAGFDRVSPVLAAPVYADLLFQLGAKDITALEKVYPHVLEDADAVVEWTRGTLLLPYMERLTRPMQDRFLTSYRSRVRTLLPGSPVFYGFKRILLHAAKQSDGMDAAHGAE